MPDAIAFACSFPGCQNRAGSCSKHDRPVRFDEAFYSSPEWRRIRAAHLALEPFCRDCVLLGRFVKANQVNHIKPRKRGGSSDHKNLESLCRAHHTRKTFAGR